MTRDKVELLKRLIIANHGESYLQEVLTPQQLYYSTFYTSKYFSTAFFKDYKESPPLWLMPLIIFMLIA
nr:MAG TPA: hypothetical protein [Caudoviricetes sp.]